MFESTKMVVKDPTHCVRRFLSRPFAAIPEIHEVHSTLITRGDSMTCTLQFSDVLGSAFAEFCKKMHDNKRVRNLQFRKHRFDSCQRPTGRFVLYAKAFISTAIFASTHRKGERDGARAEQFLQYISKSVCCCCRCWLMPVMKLASWCVFSIRAIGTWPVCLQRSNSSSAVCHLCSWTANVGILDIASICSRH